MKKEALTNIEGYYILKLNFDALVKSPKSPFDKLRANGGMVEIIDFSPFVVSLSNHRKDFLRDQQGMVIKKLRRY